LLQRVVQHSLPPCGVEQGNTNRMLNEGRHTGALSGDGLYGENKLGYFNAKGVSIPVAVSVFLTNSIQPRGAGQSGCIPN
jgi:hypothetical protein